MIYKDNYAVSAWGEVRLPAIIIIHSTNIESILLLHKESSKCFSYCLFSKSKL